MSETGNEGAVQAHLELGRPMSGLPDVVAVLQAVDDLWVGSFDLAHVSAGLPIPEPSRIRVEGWYSYEISPLFPDLRSGHRFDVPRLNDVKLSLQSPFVIDLAGLPVWEAVVGSGTVGFLRYALRNPEQVASWLPRAAAGWHENWARVSRARTDRQRARDEDAQYQREREVEIVTMGASARVVEACEVIARAEPIRVDVQGPGQDWEPPL